MRHLKLKGVVAALAVAGFASLAQAGPVTDRMLAAEAGDAWLHANGNWAGTRYSTLTQINSRNARNLKVAWTTSVGAKTDSQATPIFHDGLLFFPQDNKVFAQVAIKCVKTVSGCQAKMNAMMRKLLKQKHVMD